MNKKEITKVIMILKTSYPYAFKDMSQEELENMVNLYQTLFKNNSYEQVSNAVMDIINTSEHMPTIATIKNKIYENNHPHEKSNTELWEELLNAIRNGSYHSEEEFKKLPPIVKEFLGSPRQLQELAILDSETIHSVVKGQFLRQIETIKQNFKEYEITGKSYLLGEQNFVELEEVID